MAAPHASESISTDEGAPWDGHLRIDVTQISQDIGAFTSRVLVEGTLTNDNDWGVGGRNDIERDIRGDGDHTPDNFAIGMSPHSTYRFISHTFTIPHDDDGRKVVTFYVHYGRTDTPTFQHDMQVGVSLRLTSMAVGGWVRAGGKWVHGTTYVRYQKKWKPAVAYVRTGGVWKACQ